MMGFKICCILVLTPFLLCVSGQGSTITCFSCSNYVGNEYNNKCAKNMSANFLQAAKEECDGQCFTRQDPNDEKVGIRGCTTTLTGLPEPLPPAGCYDWEGVAFCTCDQSLCNLVVLGQSSGVALDAHLKPKEEGETSQGSTITCFSCSNYVGNEYNNKCAKNMSANFLQAAKEECDGQCFIRQDPNDEKVGIRGCTTTLTGLPDPLPPAGCYDWEGVAFCTCDQSLCNLVVLGQSSGVALDAHLKPKEEGETSQGSTITCFSCSNYVGNEYNNKCAKNMSANFLQAAKEECDGQCFIRQDPNDEKVGIRGCTTTLTGLPDPLPPAGCYDWEGVAFCTCDQSLCNLVVLGQSSGVALDAHLKPKEEGETSTTRTITCFTCSNYVGNEYNNKCPKNMSANFLEAAKDECDGQCFTRQDPNDEKVVIRGCTSSLTDLPEPLPKGGCYDWEGATFCNCDMPLCNMVPLGESAGVALDNHLNPQIKEDEKESIETRCYQCKSYVNGEKNDACPGNKMVNLLKISTVVCDGPCFTRQDPNDEKVVERGCTSSLSGLPDPLPPDGCYDWEGVTFCICVVQHCNLLGIGQSTGAPLDSLATPDGGDKMTAKPNTGNPVVEINCYECSNYNGDVYNANCPENKIVNLIKAPNSLCAGKCFTRQDPDNEDLVTRGCTSSLKGLPDKLPSDGCYDWKDVTFCVCSKPYCNMVAIGISTGISLNGQESGTGDVTIKNTCYQCTNYLGDKHYEFCPKNATVDLSKAYAGECDGACFTREDPADRKVVVRGCASSLGTLPNPLPEDGCYDWDFATFCICKKPYCNMIPLGKSSGVSLDAHLANEDTGEIPDEEGPLQCFQCLNYNAEGDYFSQCPKDSRVNPQTVYSGNCTGACLTRTYKDNPDKVGRGCTDSQYGLPHPLPEDGCYDWYGEVYCVCTKQRCNGAPLGKSSGIEFDKHLQDLVIEEDDGIMKCYQCVNYDSQGTYYPQCAKHSRVRNAYLGPCNGTCFTRSYDYDDRIVARGCSDTQPQMPKPLPPDGCYKYYSEVWCICTKSRCNGVAIGSPKDKELDYLAQKDKEGSGGKNKMTQLQVFLFLFLCFLTRNILI